MDFILFGGFAFVLCALLMPLFLTIGRWVGLMDHPSGRKQHLAPTPIVGGIVIFIALFAAVLLAPKGSFSQTLLMWLGLVLVVGVLDDLFDVSYRIRLLCHAVVVVGIYLTNGIVVGDVGAIAGGGTVNLVGYAAVFFTIVGVVGVVNAVNMSDGADGLLGGLTFVSLVTVFGFSINQNVAENQISDLGIVMLLGALAAFLLFNSRLLTLPRAMVFMGDAGSTTIGFVLAYLLIDYSQSDGSLMSPVVAGWVVGLPLLDASGVILYRVMAGHSPFHPDRSHMHHLLMDVGFSVNRTVTTLIIIHAAMISFALLVSNVIGDFSDALLFWGFIILVVARAGFAFIYNKKTKYETKLSTKGKVLARRSSNVDVSAMVGTTSSDSIDSVSERFEKSSAK